MILYILASIGAICLAFFALLLIGFCIIVKGDMENEYERHGQKR